MERQNAQTGKASQAHPINQLKGLRDTDPEFVERFEHFAFNEVVNEENQQLAPTTRYLAILATLIGCGGVDAFREVLADALEPAAPEGAEPTGGAQAGTEQAGTAPLTPVMVKEVVYQAADYLGYGRMLPFLKATNAVLQQRGVALPLPGQATATIDDRLEKGVAAQVEIFGEQMNEAWKASHIGRWLAANCFGDYYTRTGLDLAQRELITFCFLLAQGGCEPQLTSHARGNMNMGNDRDFLVRVVSQCLPYIGYPRSLNAMRCIEQAAAQ